MRALIITTYGPQWEGVEFTGTHWRFRLLVKAICQLADEVELLHLVPYQFVAANPGVEAVGAQQSAYFGAPVTTHLIRCQAPRNETFFRHYVAGISSVYEQQDYFQYSGAEQTAAVGAFLDRSPDVVVVHRLAAMLPVIRSLRRPARMFFDLDDVVHRVRFQTALRPPIRPGQLGYLFHVPAIAAAERRGAALSRLTFVCSELDRARLRRLGFARVAVVPNALPVPSAPSELPRTPTILFLGTCWYQPNKMAAERLVRRIFPRVRARVPEARLVIAGESSLELASRRERPEGVQYLGYVDNLTELYASARLVCCPITGGSGTRVKLIEAAGYARPLVATRFAAEGLDFRDGVEILLRDDDDAIAAECVQLMRDDARCRALGAAAHARMREKYDALAIQRTIIKMISETCESGC
ncbi:MAG: glycosyltransferase family 4 protein [Alphaproteobacteria bacterium]|nr:glycosyltransferase family 4 protein [Alphaproteobacteria bacterium]